MKRLLVVLLMGTLILAGCSSAAPEVGAEVGGNVYATPVDYLTTEKGSVGFSDALQTVGNFAPGKQADIPITFHNGGDEVVNLAVTYRTPDYTKEGYVAASEEAKSWLFIPEPLIELKPKERREVVVTLIMPEEAEAVGNWEFWITVKDASQTGTVQTEGCVRIFVNMR